MLRIEDDALAELHAVVNVKEDGTVQILDLGSSEGSKVNGEAVSGNADLASGDTISVGPINIALTIETPEEAVEEAKGACSRGGGGGREHRPSPRSHRGCGGQRSRR